MSPRITLGVIVAALALAIFALACAGPQPMPLAPTSIPTLIPATLPPAPTEAPLPTSTGPSGASIFSANCSSCHTLTAEQRVGPGLAGLFERAQLPDGNPMSDENLAGWVRTGGGGMPPFAFSDAEMAALIAYLKEATGAASAATAAPAATAAAQSTPLPVTVTADAFNSKCSACHNLTAELKVGPGLQGLFSLPALPNGQPVTDESLRDWMRSGGGSMPPIALSDAEVVAIIAYLRHELGGAAPVTSPPAGSPGEAVFAAQCSACHNLTAERKVGPGLQGMFTRITTLPNGEPFDEKELRDFIRKGGGAMPEVKLEDDEYDAVIAYLKVATASGAPTVTPGSTVSPLELIVADQTAAAYFQDGCSGCHGVDRRGATGPALLPARLTQPDDYYIDVIRDGKPGTVMPPWGATLSDADIRNLVAFIRSDPPVGSVQWTMADISDSLTVLLDEATLPAAPTHTGDIDNLMLVTERETQKIAVIDGNTFELLAKIPASYRAHGYTFSPTNPRWAYNMGRDGWVFKIDLFTLQPVRKVRIGLDARAIAISDDGRVIIAGNYLPATMVLLDAETLEPLELIAARATNPEGEMIESRVATIVDTAPQLAGPYFLVALKEAGQVWRIDWSQPDFPITTLDNVGHILHDGFLSLDNRIFYLASQQDNWMAAIDVTTMTVVKRISTGSTPHPGSGAVWEAEGVQYGATTHAGEGKIAIWNLSTNEMVASLATSGPGLFIRSSEASPYVWADEVFAVEPHAITVFEKAPPFEVVGVITEGVRTLHPEFTADGAYVYIADWDGNVVRVYDARTLEKVAEITGIDNPTGIFNTSRRHEPLGH